MLNYFFGNISTLKFPHASTPVMKNMLNFHEKCLFIMIFVLVIVFILLIYNTMNMKSGVLKLEKTWFEMGWTVVPSLIILMLMAPSLEVLYFSEESGSSKYMANLKVIAHQWYWSYEEVDSSSSQILKKSVNFDSYMMKDSDLFPGEFRNCEVDRPVVLEVKKAQRLLMTSADVIHSWAVPEFGVKVDAIPGRLNQIIIYTPEVGRFFGFCSELCGVNHSFMPIVVEVISTSSLS